MTILDEILEHKRGEVVQAKRAVPPSEMAALARTASDATRGFRTALTSGGRPRVIAEIKQRSPSKGEIRMDFDPMGIGKAYADNGAAAISVLTDEHFFGGHLDYLAVVRDAVSLPLLRKDFVVEAYQIDEARARGADAVLLMAVAFPGEDCSAQLRDLREHAFSLGLDVLLEVHDEAELDAALSSGADLVGVNNRDLKTFVTDLAVTERLAPRVPDGVVLVAESGITTPEDISRLEAVGSHAVLVGESLMRKADIGSALRELRRTT